MLIGDGSKGKVMTPAWTAGRVLVHYTKDAATVASILENGFLLIPNRRELIDKFLNGEHFAVREPQYFGMISFAELGLADLATHHAAFGKFGIAVSWEWALAKMAQRVIYVADDGPIFAAFRWLFQLGEQELATSGADPGVVQMGRTNNVFANLSRRNLYAVMLTIYEYMQPESQSPQVEWRIVNDVPFFHDPSKSKAEIVAELLNLPKTWRNSLGAVSVAPSDVLALLCPADQVENLRATLPERFAAASVVAYQHDEASSHVVPRVLEKALDHPPDADGSPISEGSAESRPAPPQPSFSLVGWIENLAMYPNELVRAAYFEAEYSDQDGNRRRLRVPASQAAYLLGGKEREI